MIERLEAAKKCDRISGGAVRPLRIRLSQHKLQMRKMYTVWRYEFSPVDGLILNTYIT
jgi:hypothetical protein